MENRIPYKLVKRILKEYLEDSEISKEYVENVRKYLEEIIKDIANKSKEQLEVNNHFRKIQGLPKLKRYRSDLLRNLYLNHLAEIYKLYPDFKIGDVGNASANVTTTLSDAGVR